MEEIDRFWRSLLGPVVEVAFFVVLAHWMGEQNQRHETERRNRSRFRIF